METNKKTSRLIGVLLAVLSLLSTSPLYADDWVYSAVNGDNLWDLSEKYLDKATRWKVLQKINAIKNPRQLQPGTLIRMPMKWIKINPTPARIHALQGTITLIRADGSRITAPDEETKLFLGDQIITSTDSDCVVRFADNSKTFIRSESQVQFNHLTTYGDTGMVDSRLHLLKGRADTIVIPASGPGSRFEINSPSAISAVRGTQFRMSTNASENSSQVEVLKGKVAVSGEKRTELIAAGFGTRIELGSAPTKPRPLLPPPTLKSIPSKIEQLNWPVSWQPLDKATAYRVELSTTDSFEILSWSRRTESTRAPLPDLADGYYYMRVRGIDHLGLEGLSRRTRVHLDTHPQPPVPLQPDAGQVYRAATPTLRWSASSEAIRYRLQIATDAKFSNIKIDQPDLDMLQFKPESLTQTGTYYWRLMSIDQMGEQGPISMVRSWIVKPIPETPSAELISNDASLTASWREGAEGQTYQVQLAEEADFKKLILDLSPEKPQLELEQVKGQVRFLRVRYIEPDGYQGPWGATQRIDPLPSRGWVSVLGFALLGILML